MGEIVNVASDMKTFLSPNVYHIVVETRRNSKSEGPTTESRSFITQHCTFDWQRIGTWLSISEDLHIPSQPSDWFPSVIERMWPVCDEAYTTLTNINSKSMAVFWDLCKWTGKEKELEEFYEDFQSHNNTSTVEAILFVTSVLENSLGNVYLQKGKTVPFLLRDLLATSELTSILGRNPIVFLQLLLGTPASLNVRNLVWHGFPGPDELCPSLAATLFAVVASVGQLLSGNLTPLPQRPMVTHLSQLTEQMDLPPADLVPQRILSALTESSLVSSQHIAYWKSAVHHYQNGRWGRCCLVVLPQLEHLIRVAYCRAHNCPTRLLTAESSARYLTLDDLLDASDTSMLLLLGGGLLQLLRDLLSLPIGPRLRDRLSHGEVRLTDVPQCLAGHLLAAAASISLRFKPEMSQPYDNYIPRFHNVAILKTAILRTVKSLSIWKQCPRQPEALCPDWNKLVNVNEDLCILQQQLLSNIREVLNKQQRYNVNNNNKCNKFESVINMTDAMEMFISNIHIPTVPLPKISVEVISIFRQVIQNVEATSTNVISNLELKTHLLASHKLRSRQRITYMRLITVVPQLQAVLECVVNMTAVHLLSLIRVHTIPEVYRASYIRFLKTVLQFVELTASRSSPEKNRWEEINILSKQFCQQIVKNNYLNFIPIENTADI